MSHVACLRKGLNNMARIIVHRSATRVRKLSLRADRIGLVEDVSADFKDGTKTQIQYAMPNGAKYVNVTDDFDSVLKAVSEAR